MTNAQKVANIFEMASAAFGKLSELTLELKLYQSHNEQVSTSSRWTIVEVELLKDAISRFGSDLAKIADVLENKSITQIKHKIRNKAFMDAGMGEPPEEDDDDDENDMENIGELPRVPTVSVDRGRRKQTFSERNESVVPQAKKQRVEGMPPGMMLLSNSSLPSPSISKAPQQMPVRMPISRPSVMPPTDYEFVQQQPSGEFHTVPKPTRISMPQMQPKKRPMNPSDKYEDYSDDASERFDVPEDDDDDDEESDTPYYSEDE